MSESPPSAKRLSEQDAWIYGGVGTAAFSTMLGAGLFGFYEDHQVLGTIFTAIGMCGLVAMVILLKGHRLTILHSAMAALVVTWLYFGYIIWDGPHTIVVHDPATVEEIAQMASPLMAERDASRQQATVTQNELDEKTHENDSIKKQLEGEIKTNSEIQTQLAGTQKDRDAEKQRADNAIKERDAANQKLASLQSASASQSGAGSASVSVSTFAQTYSLTEPQIKELTDEVFAIKSSLPPNIVVQMVEVPSTRQLATQLRRAFDLAGANPSGLSYGHPTSPKDVGVMIRVRDLQAIPEGAKILSATIGKVTGVAPKFISSSELAPSDFTVLVGPNPND